MKKIFILILLITLTFSSFAQNVLSVTSNNFVLCNGGTATIDVATDAFTDFDYLNQVQLPNTNWINAGIMTTVTVPPAVFAISGLFAGTYRIILFG